MFLRDGAITWNRRSQFEMYCKKGNQVFSYDVILFFTEAVSLCVLVNRLSQWAMDIFVLSSLLVYILSNN